MAYAIQKVHSYIHFMTISKYYMCRMLMRASLIFPRCISIHLCANTNFVDCEIIGMAKQLETMKGRCWSEVPLWISCRDCRIVVFICQLNNELGNGDRGVCACINQYLCLSLHIIIFGRRHIGIPVYERNKWKERKMLRRPSFYRLTALINAEVLHSVLGEARKKEQ